MQKHNDSGLDGKHQRNIMDVFKNGEEKILTEGMST